MISVRYLEWMAGFMEGEGYFTSSRSTPLVGVTQQNKEPLDRIINTLKFGTIKYCNPLPKRNPFFYWTCYGQNAIAVGETLFALMSQKRRDQISQMILKWKNAPGRGRTICQIK